MKLKKTTKKFYNKWLYKVSLHIHGATCFRREIMAYYSRKIIDGDTLESLQDYLETTDPSIYQVRVEGSILDLYTNEQSIIKDIQSKFKNHVRYISEPDENLLNHDLDFIPIVANKLPHNKYNYKAFLKPHTLKNDTDAKLSYLNFLNFHSENIKMTDNVYSWFLETNYNWDPRYIYVADKNTLLMVKMRGPSVLGRIYQYLVPDK